MVLYRVLFVFAVIALIGCKILLLVVKPLKNRFAYKVNKDDLFKSYKDDFGYNDIYSTTGETRNFINRYVIRSNRTTKTLICNYTRLFKDISYHVVCLNKKSKPIKVFNAHETNVKTNTSVIFLLPNDCEMVNVVIQNVDGVSYNDKVIASVPKAKCRFYTTFESVSFFSLLYIIRHLLIEIIGNGYQEVFFDNIVNLLTLLFMGVVTLVYAIMLSAGLRRRNYKTRIGGSLEYEFF